MSYGNERPEKTIVIPWYEDGKYSWPKELFDENGMLLPGNEYAEAERNKRIWEAFRPLFEMHNFSDKFILSSPVWRIRFFYNGR